MESKKETAISCKSLICFLQSLISENCDFELKNDLQLTGKLINVDSNMNVELRDVTLKRATNILLNDFTIEKYDYLFLKGEKIRYVQFSDRIDVKQNIKNKLDQYHNTTKQVLKNNQEIQQFKQAKYDKEMNKLFKKQR